MRRSRFIKAVIAAECLASGLLGLFVGLDYLARVSFLGTWNTGYDVLHALLGEPRATDLLQDYGGARALLFGGNAYEPTGALAQRYVQGGEAYLSYVSAHPPTAFLLFVPLAALPFGAASATWALVMLAGLIACTRACGAWWYAALFIGPLLLLLPPVASGVNQLAVAWLVLAILAFHGRRQPALAGSLIGLASLTKYSPALLVVPFIARRQWRAVAALVIVWIGALLGVAVFNVGALFAYITAGAASTAGWVSEPGNGAFLVVPLRYSVLAEAAAVVLVAWIVAIDVRLGAADEEGRWARWNWLAVAVLPIAWSFSVIPLALTLIVLFHQRRWLSCAISCAGTVPLLLSVTIDPALPTFLCIASVGVGLALVPFTRPLHESECAASASRS